MRTTEVLGPESEIQVSAELWPPLASGGSRHTPLSSACGRTPPVPVSSSQGLLPVCLRPHLPPQPGGHGVHGIGGPVRPWWSRCTPRPGWRGLGCRSGVGQAGSPQRHSVLGCTPYPRSSRAAEAPSLWSSGFILPSFCHKDCVYLLIFF